MDSHEDPLESRFSVVDYALFGLMLAISVGIGVWSAYRSRGKESAQDYLLGNRSMPYMPVVLSLIGGNISAISILGNPTEVYLYGTQVTLYLLGFVFGVILVRQLLLPIFYKLDLFTLNEYLHLRYKSRVVRTIGLLCQMALHITYMGVCLYAPSLALSTATGLSSLTSILIMGLVCTFYITVGGVKAVVYTDTLQSTLMFSGVMLVVVICCRELGFSTLWDIAEQGNRLEFFNFDTSPFVRHTFWSTTMMGFYFTINGLGLSQPSYQRFASVGNVATGQKICVLYLIFVVVLWVVFFFPGLVAYAMYRDCDPLTSGRIQKPDQIMPYLVMDKLGYLPGIPGVFVAAVYGGVLSSVSSSGNSIASLMWTDFLKDFAFFKKMSDKSATRVLKIISAVAGLVGTLLSLAMGQLGDIFNVMNSFIGAALGPSHGLYLAAMCTPWVNSKGAIVGFLTAFVYNAWVVVGQFLRGGNIPPRLPLDTSGCPENLIANFTTTTDPSSTWSTPEPEPMGDESHTIYDISYCYFGITGIVLSMLVNNIVSIVTGPTSPNDVDEKYCTPLCRRLHRWLWNVCSGAKILQGALPPLDQATAMNNIPPPNKTPDLGL